MQTYSDEIKAQVIAEWNLGTPKAAIARKLHIPRTTVIAWLAATESPVQTLSDSVKRDELGQLVYDYLSAGLRALIAQAVAMGDPEWFKQQAGSQHLIHGVLADKLVTIFAGVENGTQSETDNA